MKIALIALGMIAAISTSSPALANSSLSAGACLTIELGTKNYLNKALDMVYFYDNDQMVSMISENVRKIEILEPTVIKISSDFYSVTYELRQNCNAGIDVVNKKVERIKPNYGGGLG